MNYIDSMIKRNPVLSADKEKELLRKKDIEKSKILNISPQGSMYLNGLINNKLVENVSATHIVVNLHLDEHESKVREITKKDFDLIWKILNDTKKAMEVLVNSNLRLVSTIARRNAEYGTDLYNDLFDAGLMGLWTAIKRFDSKLDYRLSTYAVPTIQGAITERLRETDTIKLTDYSYKIMNEIKKADEALEKKLQRKPTDEELVKELKKSSRLCSKRKNLNPWYIAYYRRLYRKKTSLDENEAAKVDGGIPLGPTHSDFEDPNPPSPQESVANYMNKEKAQAIFRDTNAREAKIIEMRFGLKDEQPMSVREIGRKLGISHVRVKQIEDRHFEKMKEIVHSMAKEKKGNKTINKDTAPGA